MWYSSYLFVSYNQMPIQFWKNLDTGFSVLNLICIPPRASAIKSNLDGFIQINIKGPDTFGESDIENHFVSLFALI